MKKHIETWVRVAIAALALNLFGCGGNPEPVTGNGDDAGMTIREDRPQTTTDAGMPAVDAGSPAVDASVTTEDAPQVKTWAETACAAVNKFSEVEALVDGSVVGVGEISCEIDIDHPDGNHISVTFRRMSTLIARNGALCEHNEMPRATACVDSGNSDNDFDEVDLTMAQFTWGRSGSHVYQVRGALCRVGVDCPLTNR